MKCSTHLLALTTSILLLTACSTSDLNSDQQLLSTYAELQESIVDKEEQQRTIEEENREIRKELQSLHDNLQQLATKQTRTYETPHPQDRIQESQIRVNYYGVTLDIQGVQQNYLIDSNSMDPLFDEGATLLSVMPTAADDIKTGDIIIFHSPTSDIPVAHRVQNRSEDQRGIYYKTKGDNNPEPDSYRVRYADVIAVVVGILY